MNLTEAFTLRAAIPEPADYGATTWGPRVFVRAGEGRVEGDRLRADIVPDRGGDWLLRTEGSDGAYNVPDIRHTLRTDDGALILLRAHGFRSSTMPGDVRPGTGDRNHSDSRRPSI